MGGRLIVTYPPRPDKPCSLRVSVGEKLIVQADGALAVGALVVIIALAFAFGGGAEMLSLFVGGSS